MLAVQVEYKNQRAIIGTKKGESVPIDDLLGALDSIGYRGHVEQASSVE